MYNICIDKNNSFMIVSKYHIIRRLDPSHLSPSIDGTTQIFATQARNKTTLILLFKQTTANAKDSEVIKKVHGFWVIQLKN